MTVQELIHELLDLPSEMLTRQVYYESAYPYAKSSALSKVSVSEDDSADNPFDRYPVILS